MEQLFIIEFLNSFFNLFDAHIEEFEIVDKRILGTVGWFGENDKQDFVFNDEFDASLLLNTKLLCDFLYKKEFNQRRSIYNF